MSALLLASCAVPSPTIDASFDPGPYRPFITPAPLLPFRATGSVRFQYAGEKESGRFLLAGGEGHAFRLQLLAPITGALVVELRFDERRLLAINHAEQTYFSAENTAPNRRRLFGLDITAREFLMLLTGRVPRPAYQAGAGRAEGPRRRVMESGGVRYRFQLDEHGLPKTWRKERKENGDYRVEYRVEYREFLAIGDPPAPPLRLPRKIRVSAGNREAGGALLVMGIREFHAGARPPRPLTFELPPGTAWRFLELPGQAP